MIARTFYNRLKDVREVFGNAEYVGEGLYVLHPSHEVAHIDIVPPRRHEKPVEDVALYFAWIAGHIHKLQANGLHTRGSDVFVIGFPAMRENMSLLKQFFSLSTFDADYIGFRSFIWEPGGITPPTIACRIHDVMERNYRRLIELKVI